MASAFTRIAAIVLAILLLGCLIVAALGVVSSPAVIGMLVRVTQSQSTLELSERLRVADITTRFVRTGTHEIEMVETYRTDNLAGPESIGHLLDVRDVFTSVWVIGCIALALLVAIFVTSVLSRRIEWLVSSIRIASGLCIALPLAFGLGSLVAFGPLFTVFHQVFFPQGNWQFPTGSLLIQTFPERFWMLCLVTLLSLILLFGIVIFSLLTRLASIGIVFRPKTVGDID